MTPLKKCPICGSRRIERVRESVELHPCGRVIRVPDVEFDRCGNCGERFFNHDASQRIDAAVVAGNAERPASGAAK